MPKTLLAVDDSATMRKVLEITFAGEDLRVVTAESASSALGRLSEDPAVVIIDVSLGTDDAYGLAKEVRSRNPRSAVLMLASRYGAYDPGRGRDAGVDDFIDKPFDTQALIDKVKKLLGREPVRSSSLLGGSVNIAPPLGGSINATSPLGGSVNVPAPSAPRPPAAPAAPPAPPPRAWPAQRTAEASPPQGPTMPTLSPVTRTAPSVMAASQQAVPTLAPGAASGAPPAPARVPPFDGVRSGDGLPGTAGRAAAAVTGPLAGKLDELGLTAEQVRAVLALSRELVERVVWEVVPPMAEAMIKEEIARLTNET